MKRKACLVSTVLLILLSLLGIHSASAADELIPNYSFESGLTSWTPWGVGGASASTTQKYTGTSSVKIVDTSTTVQYGAESAMVGISANKYYMIYARAYIESGAADLYIRFFDSSQNYISTAFVSKSTPVNEWTYLKVKALSPANAAYATALVYSNKLNTGTVYWDDIFLTADFSNLGSQVYGEAGIHSATFGKNASNQDVIYAVADGSTSDPVNWPAKLVVVDINGGTVTGSIPLNGSGVSWAATTATDGKIYVGAVNTGKLYQYTPGNTSAVDLGVALGESHIFSITSGAGGKVYGGTANHAKFFKWDSVGGFFEIQASNPIFDGITTTYVRSIAHDIANNKTYLGGGVGARLVYFDNNSGNRYDILPASYASDEFLYTLDVTGGKVFAGLARSSKMLVLNVVHNGSAAPTVTVDAEIPAVHSLGVSPAVNGKVYYTANAVLYEYNLATKTSTSLGVSVGYNPPEIGVVQLTDQTNWPGSTVVTLGKKGGSMTML